MRIKYNWINELKKRQSAKTNSPRVLSIKKISEAIRKLDKAVNKFYQKLPREKIFTCYRMIYHHKKRKSVPLSMDKFFKYRN